MPKKELDLEAGNLFLQIVRHKSWNCLSVCSILLPEAGFQLIVFHPNHDNAQCNSKCRQSITNAQASADAPTQHLAEMPQVHRMTNARSYPGHSQPLLLACGHKLRHSADLPATEAARGFVIQPEAAQKRDNSRPTNPGEFVKRSLPPLECHQRPNNPRCCPAGKQHSI